MQEQISHFITDNDTGDLKDSILWDTLKVVIREHVSRKRRAEGRRQKDIECDLSFQEI